MGRSLDFGKGKRRITSADHFICTGKTESFIILFTAKLQISPYSGNCPESQELLWVSLNWSCRGQPALHALSSQSTLPLWMVNIHLSPGIGAARYHNRDGSECGLPSKGCGQSQTQPSLTSKGKKLSIVLQACDSWTQKCKAGPSLTLHAKPEIHSETLTQIGTYTQNKIMWDKRKTGWLRTEEGQ